MSLQIIEDDDYEEDEPEVVEGEVVETSLVPYSDIPPEAEIAFQDYKNLGKSRSVTSLQRHYLRLLEKDAYAPVPTTNIHLLSQWETQYNWKTLAWEHDADTDHAFTEHRKVMLVGVYDGQEEIADEMTSLAKVEMVRLKKAQLENKPVLTPQEVLMYMKEGAKLRKEAVEQKLQLEDPNKQTSVSSGDFFDTLRHLALLQVNNSKTNVYSQGI